MLKLNFRRLFIVFGVIILLFLSVSCGRAEENVPDNNDNIQGDVDNRGGATSDGADEMLPLDRYHYELSDTSYAILQISNITDETLLLTQNRKDSLGEYTKVECAQLYCYSTSQVTDIIDDLIDIYIISNSVGELKNNDIIFIQLEQMSMDGVKYLGPITNNHQAEYIPVIDDRVVFVNNEQDTESFSKLFALNQRILEIEDYIKGGGKTNEAINALPKTKFSDNMLMSDLIDYLTAWGKVKSISDRLIAQTQNEYC